MRHVLFFGVFLCALAKGECVQIYYDAGPGVEGAAIHSRVQVIFLQNLLGHFPKFQQIIKSVESYQKNELDRCRASFYIGTYYDNSLPNDFLTDFAETSRTVVWLGYNLWHLSNEKLKELWGIRFSGLTNVDWNTADSSGHPGFYKYFSYQGEQFEKNGYLSQQKFFAAYEMSRLILLPGSPSEVLSLAKHSTHGDELPYIIRNLNHWVVADSPFSFIHEEDRYLIFADVLFDILEEKPRYRGKKPALIRLEDVHVKVPGSRLDRVSQLLRNTSTPYVISLIPTFADPLMKVVQDSSERMIKLEDRPAFAQRLRQMVLDGGTIVFHGATHQYGETENPFSGVSGVDFEFWSPKHQTPVPGDSASFVLERLESGYAMLEGLGLRPAAWLTPHYSASALDQKMFSQLFMWSIGRMLYFPASFKQKEKLPLVLSFDIWGSAGNGHRMKYFSDLEVSNLSPDAPPAGQFFPYEIYGDYYGSRIVPENVGFLEEGRMSFNKLRRIIRRNRVLRDTWASFFVHPYLFDGADNDKLLRELEATLDEVRAAGFEFVDLKTHLKKMQPRLRPQPIEERPALAINLPLRDAKVFQSGFRQSCHSLSLR